MSFTKALDVSQYQGNIDWNAVKAAGYDIALIKVSGGDAGDYVDSLAGAHYNGARAAGMAVGTYHFAGHSDAFTEANYFFNVCSPLDENQVLILDYDTDTADAVDWVNTFTHRIHELCNVWPIVYVNGSTFNNHDWSVVSGNCGFWIAWYGKDPEQDLPVNGTYIAHQYTSQGSVPGVAGNVDLDAVYMTVEQFNKYGYHSAALPPVQPADPVPVPQPEPTPTPSPEPTPEEPPVVVPPVVVPETPETDPTPVNEQKSTAKGLIAGIVAALAAAIAAIIAWLHS